MMTRMLVVLVATAVEKGICVIVIGGGEVQMKLAMEKSVDGGSGCGLLVVVW
ncbi:hypothetical protein C5167_030754 [Papaver somniferum]|nr:hypothetical protein C5167_030754 [Papaver somniferum]